jgi:hypothetical protein
MNESECILTPMGAKSEAASWAGLDPMGAAQQARVTTKADAPRLGDRVKEVLKSDSQHRSGWEWTVYVVSLVLVVTAGSIIWRLSLGIGMRVITAVIALLVIGSVSTAILVKLRFRS